MLNVRLCAMSLVDITIFDGILLFEWYMPIYEQG